MATNRCQRCALQVPAGVAVCGLCLRDPPAFDACFAAVDYAYPWSEILAAFKFHGDASWARTLAPLLCSVPGVADAVVACDRIVCIPLSNERLRERGFNQAALLAQQMDPSKADPHSLLRIHATEAQSRLSRAQRLRNLQGAFAVDPLRARRLQGQHILLIDDVMTTGATLQAASLALREAGVIRITAVVLARTEKA